MEQPTTTGAAGRAFWLICCAVLLATATWFAGTAATPNLIPLWGLSDGQAAVLTSSVQLGFVVGTLLYAMLNLADRFNTRRVFFVSALLAALFNAAFATLSDGVVSASIYRFLTGVMLAGVYPVGMKLVASWFDRGLGWRLGVMVGALVLGTALPFAFRLIPGDLDWRMLALVASAASLTGGLMVRYLIGDGPHLRHAAPFDVHAMFRVFKHRAFRDNSFGYFGHMWELYAYYSLVIFYLQAALLRQGTVSADRLALLTFFIGGAGTLGCVIGGRISRHIGERRVALWALLASASACLLSGFAFYWPSWLLVPFLILWGAVVVADSPQFSALATRYCPPEYTGTALTVQNGVGFAITIIAIQLLPELARWVGWQGVFLFLAPGPLLGARYMWRLGYEDEAV
jgi:MFS family permease